MDKILPIGVPIICIVVGWFLKAHVDSYYRFKRKLRVALADLLEIRHFLKGYSLISAEMTSIGKIAGGTPKDMAQLRSAILQILPIDPDLDKRYSQTVTAICEVDPIAGFRLRSLNLARGLLHSVISMQMQLQAETPCLPEIDKPVTEVWLPHLDQVIRSVAWKCSFTQWLKIRLSPLSPSGLPKEAVALIEDLKAQVAKMVNQAPKPDDSPTAANLAVQTHGLPPAPAVGDGSN